MSDPEETKFNMEYWKKYYFHMRGLWNNNRISEHMYCQAWNDRKDEISTAAETTGNLVFGSALLSGASLSIPALQKSFPEARFPRIRATAIIVLPLGVIGLSIWANRVQQKITPERLRVSASQKQACEQYAKLRSKMNSFMMDELDMEDKEKEPAMRRLRKKKGVIDARHLPDRPNEYYRQAKAQVQTHGKPDGDVDTLTEDQMKEWTKEHVKHEWAIAEQLAKEMMARRVESRQS